MGNYILFVLADGAFLPVVSCVFFGAVIVLAGEEFDCCSISLSFGDDADGAVISVGKIGRLGGNAVVLRDLLVAASIRRKVRGHDDGVGIRCLSEGTVKAEIRPGVEKYIVCRAGGQIAAFIRWAVVLIAAEVQAAGKGEVRSIIQYKYTAAPILGLIAGDGTLLEGKR